MGIQSRLLYALALISGSLQSECFFTKQPLIFGGLGGDTIITDGIIEKGRDRYAFVGYTESPDLFGSANACIIGQQSLSTPF